MALWKSVQTNFLPKMKFSILIISLNLPNRQTQKPVKWCSLLAKICWSSRRHDDVFKTYLEDVLKTWLQDVFKTSRTQAKCFLGISVSGADPAFLVRGGPNSEIFLSDLRILFKSLAFCSILLSLVFRGSTFYHQGSRQNSGSARAKNVLDALKNEAKANFQKIPLASSDFRKSGRGGHSPSVITHLFHLGTWPL